MPGATKAVNDSAAATAVPARAVVRDSMTVLTEVVAVSVADRGDRCQI
jgi:hypothetical protein